YERRGSCEAAAGQKQSDQATARRQATTAAGIETHCLEVSLAIRWLAVRSDPAATNQSEPRRALLMNATWRDQAGSAWKRAAGVFSGFVDRVVDTVLSSVVRRSRGEPRQTPRVRTLQSLLRSVVRYGLIVVVSVTVLDACGFHLSAVLAGAGVVGMAVG